MKKKIKVKTTDEKPYIFVSYAHADEDEVCPIIEELDRRGYRVWYDDGIPPGKDWPDVIGKHIMECHMMLLFVTPRYVASKNCRRELTYAQNKGRTCVCVMLKNTRLPPGVDMQLSNDQYIIRRRGQSAQTFMDQLCSCNEMEVCLREQEMEIAAATVEVATVPVRKKERKRNSSCREAKKVPRKKGRKFSDIILTGIAVFAWILILTGIIPYINAQWKQSQLLDTYRYFSSIEDKREVVISKRTVTAETIQEINQNRDVYALVFSDCTFEAGALQQLQLIGLSKLTITSCDGMDDLSFLKKMVFLRELTLKDCALTDAHCQQIEAFMEEVNHLLSYSEPADRDSLAQILSLGGCFSLQQVDLSGNRELSDVGWLEKLFALESIDVSGTNISDISVVAQQPDLKLVIAEGCPIADITPLQTAKELRVLNLNGCPVEDPQGIFTCLRLEELKLSGSRMTSLKPFENCTILQEVDISGSKIRDVSILQKSAETLHKLSFSNSELDHADLQFMKDCSALTEVFLDGIPTEDVSFLKGAHGLQTLSASSCGLKDISALSGKSKLTKLDISENQLQNISGLSRWYPMDPAALDLSGNPLADIGVLPLTNQYSTIDLRCVDLDLKTIPAISGGAIAVYYSDEIYDSILSDKTRFSKYYIYDCPPDRQVKLEDYFTSQLILCTSDAEQEMIVE